MKHKHFRKNHDVSTQTENQTKGEETPKSTNNLEAFICPRCRIKITPSISILTNHLKECKKEEEDEDVLELHPGKNDSFEEVEEPEHEKEKPKIKEPEPDTKKMKKIMEKVIQKIRIRSLDEELTEEKISEMRKIYIEDGDGVRVTTDTMTPFPNLSNIVSIRKDKTKEGRKQKLKNRILEKFHSGTTNLVDHKSLYFFLDPSTSDLRAYKTLLMFLSSAFSATPSKPLFFETAANTINYQNPGQYQREVMEHCLQGRNLLMSEEALVHWQNMRKNMKQVYQIKKKKRKLGEEEDFTKELKKLKEEVIDLEEENQEYRRKKRKQDLMKTRRAELLYQEDRCNLLESKIKKSEDLKLVCKAFVQKLWTDVHSLKHKLGEDSEYTLELPSEEESKHSPEALEEFKDLLEKNPPEDSDDSEESTEESLSSEED
jgi:hypothetical protein